MIMDLRPELARATVRGLLGALLLGGAARAGVWPAVGSVSVLCAAYFGVLAGPASLTGAYLGRRGLAPKTWHAPGVWLVLLAVVVLVHLQAAYAEAALSTGHVAAGWDGVVAETTRLFVSAPGEAGSLAGLYNIDLALATWAGVVSPLTFALLWRERGRGSVAAALRLGATVIGTAVVSTALLLALRDPGFLLHVLAVATVVAFGTVVPAVLLLTAWALGGVVVRVPAAVETESCTPLASP